ncbi:oxidoreductase [Gordonia sp. zg691]|uniref:PDR/VanB family oxidoreductase n=1 Tax=Gordonia jinghuaiqii TaxID=2758710 RepID=UPI00166260F7|nr:PDR/VanB family oxidoreductase [Gordonia jinghuaiqii]MBD0862164.1 oxidoreductase [Gordonia jinghuaiqii]
MNNTAHQSNRYRARARGVRYTPGTDIPDAFVFRLFETVTGTWWTRAAARSAGGRPPVRAVDRDLRVRIASARDEACDVRTLSFTRTDGEVFPAWDPGAHVDVVLPSGRIRQYSLTSDPADLRTYRIAVRRIDENRGGGGGSAEVHTLEPGQELTLKGPRNAFPFIDSPGGYVFVAGGIGITPILPMLRDVARRGDPYVLIYTGRDRASMPFLDEISQIVGDHDLHIWPDDEYGTPDAARIIDLAPPGAALYTCGPTPMVDAIRAQIPDPQIDTLHYERFSPPTVVGGEKFTVRLASTGMEVHVESDESALTAIRRTKPGQAYSCQQGFCGTCKVRLLDGQVEHRDHVLTDRERDDHMILCVSRAQGTISIDA